ncbi:MAG: 3-deoxy-D-manno-octulosonic acid transferase [Kiritimatiellae bacterium]|jgi:3-deoxy-D-manno-octulosonic-acid transferase|nr:3-deoxy-D-manno-octulosonic acid transferase [Kiritimatiellia bacterium]
MRWIFYNIVFSFLYLLLMPHFAMRMMRRGGYRERFGDRFGRLPYDIIEKLKSSQGRIWIHAVSVGEVFVAGQVMRELRSQDASVKFLFSTTSSTGWVQAQRQVQEEDVLIYCPLDISCFVKRVINLVEPKALVLTESEIWPNLIRCCSAKGVPIFLINARISDRSAPRYAKMNWWFEPVFRMFTLIMAQSDLDKRRLVAAGADESCIDVCGSFKFDVAQRDAKKESELRGWLDSHGVTEDKLVLLGGSTWPGEDFILINTYRELAEKYPQLRLVIVPRHFEKADDVEKNIIKSGLVCVRKSRGDSSPENNYGGAAPVLLADTTGELMGFYGLSQIVFVGKSLYEHGAQNMIEPCLCGASVIVGSHTENFRPVMCDLLDADGIIQILVDDMLLDEVEELLNNDEKRLTLGARASQAVVNRKGVVERCAAKMLKAIDS